MAIQTWNSPLNVKINSNEKINNAPILNADYHCTTIKFVLRGRFKEIELFSE